MTEMIRPVRTLFFAAVTGALLFCPVSAEGQGSRDAATRFLREYWVDGIEARRGAESHWEALEKSGSPNPEEQLAYALNRIFFGRHRDGEAASSNLLDAYSSDWDVRHLRAWLLMAAGNGDRSLLAIQDWKHALNDTTDVPEDVRLRAFQRIGRLVGFAEGPYRDKVRAQTLTDTIAVVVNGLDDLELTAFEDQRLQTRTEYEALQEELTVNSEMQREDAAREQQQEIQRIIVENETLSARREGLAQEAAQVRDRAESELSQIGARMQPIQDQIAALEPSIQLEQNQANVIANDVVFLQASLAGERDPRRRQFLLLQLSQAQIALGNQRAVVNSLRIQWDGLVGQLNALQAEYATAERTFRARLAPLESESQAIDKRLRNNSRTMSRMDDPEARKGYVRNMQGKIHYLVTYDPFPVEELRKRLLEEWK